MRQKCQTKEGGESVQRVIFHVDCNSFYASVELLRHPGLREKPVAVSGSVDDRHGIILAKNEAAKRYKVQTAETVWQAKRKCPGLILLPPHRREYKKFSRIINDIYATYTDRVEPFGIDESWLDMTGSWQLFGPSPADVAHRLRRQVKRETGLTVSVGVSYNKVFAKLGSDYKKPDAVTEITPENVQNIVWPLPVTDLLMVGQRAAETLQTVGITSIGQLAAASEETLGHLLGKLGGVLHRYANGNDESPVARIGESEPIKSVGNGVTFRRNLVGERDVRTGVNSLADEVATRLRRYRLFAGNLQVLIKNPELKSISRQKPLPYATNLAKDLADHAMDLITQNWNLANPIRMLTITAGQLSELPFAVQTSLFEAPAEMDPKRTQLEHSIDKIREKYGKTAVLPAGGLHNDIGVDSEARPEREDEEIEGWGAE